jgi:predicted transcriptional regulator
VKRLHDLTDQQLAIMAVVWDRGETTANDIHQAVASTAGLARGTVGTMLHRLERQGVLTHRTEGREYFYKATVSREEVMKARVQGLVGGLFGGDLTAMVSFAVSATDSSAKDVDKLAGLLESYRTKTRPLRGD